MVADVQVAPDVVRGGNERGGARRASGGGLRVGVEVRAALGAPLVHGALDGVSQRVGQQARAHGAGLEAADELRHVKNVSTRGGMSRGEARDER